MRRFFIEVIVTLGCIFIYSSGALAGWIESKNQGASIRHPQGWKVDWKESVVGVIHPQDPMIWCMIRFLPAQGLSSRQVAEAVMQDAISRASDIKPLKQLQVSQRPDLYGIKFGGQGNGVPFISLVLVVTEDGRNFVIRQYSAPTKAYDEMKLTLIPILRSFCLQGEETGKGGAESGGWQVIQSTHGYWRFTAPAEFKAIDNPQMEDGRAQVLATRGDRSVVVGLDGGWGNYIMLVRAGVYPNTPTNQIPYMPATDLFQKIIAPHLQRMHRMQDFKLVDLKPIAADAARYKISFVYGGSHHYIEEGVIRNSSVPNNNGGDFNLYTRLSVSSFADVFPSASEELWRILDTFEPSPGFGASINQEIARIRSENIQAATSRAMQTLQTSRQIARQHVGIAQQKPGMMAQQGQGWINAVTGQEVVRDSQSGQRYQVPVGGQYIYGRNTGEVIRADRPLQTHELPEGFGQFEAVK
jgi:hypothetical protein